MDIQILGTKEQEIHASINVPNSYFLWVMTVIYASLDIVERLVLWQNLKNIVDHMNLPG